MSLTCSLLRSTGLVATAGLERERERVERDKVAGPARRDERLSERDYEISLQVAMRCERGRNCNGIELHMSNETLLTELRKIRE
jgi:hypothetical protein